MSLLFDIGEKARLVARFLASVHRTFQDALEEEKAARKLTQQQIADEIGVNRSVINRQILGGGNLTMRRVVELALAMGREPFFELRKPVAQGNYARSGPLTGSDSKMINPPAANTATTNPLERTDIQAAA